MAIPCKMVGIFARRHAQTWRFSRAVTTLGDGSAKDDRQKSYHPTTRKMLSRM